MHKQTKRNPKAGSMGGALFTVAGFGVALAAVNSQAAAPMRGAAPDPSAVRVPITFEANRGQLEGDAAFLSRGPGYQMSVGRDGVVFDLAKGSTQRRDRRDAWPARKDAQTARIRMGLRGALAAEPVGTRPLAAKSHYLLGRDRSAWVRNVPHFGEVRQAGVYPGIDLVLHGRQAALEYDFEVKPGADPSRIQLTFQGAQTSLEADGDLALTTPAGTLRHARPVAYQMIAGQRREVAASYDLRPEGVGFRLGAYDPSRPLVIDPVVDWASFVGFGGAESGNAVSLGPDGTVYITGGISSYYNGGNSLVVPGSDVHVTRLSADGTTLIYNVVFGGTGEDEAFGIGVNGAGEPYVTGGTTSENYPVQAVLGQNIPQPNFRGVSDGFVTKLTADGSSIVYSTYIGGTKKLGDGADIGYGIAVDPQGNAYVAGRAGGSDLKLVIPVQDIYGGGDADAFVAKYGTLGQLDFCTFLGGGPYNYNGNTDYGAGLDAAYGIAVDPAGMIYVTGCTSSRNFPVVNNLQRVNRSINREETDAFVAKFNGGGKQLIYCTYLGGNSNDCGFGIATDVAGNAYVTGITRSTNFPVVDPLQGNLKGGDDAFLSKLHPLGAFLAYSTYYGGSDNDQGNGVAVDGVGDTYVVGSTSSANFPTDRPFQAGFGGTVDAFLVKFNGSGKGPVYASFFGGGEREFGSGVAVTPGGLAYIAGTTFSTNFPATGGAFDNTFGGISDAFAARISDTEPLPPGGNIQVTGNGKFGKMVVGGVLTRVLYVKNTKKTILRGVVHPPEGPFVIATGGGSFELGKNKSVKVTILFAPTFTGPVESVLRITSSDPNNSLVERTLSGIGQ